MRKIFPLLLFIISLLGCYFANAQKTLPELKPTRLAIFKNGAFFIKREADVPVTNKQVSFAPPNEVLMGTYWISVGKNTELRSASVFLDSFSSTRKVVDMEDVINSNKGKTITIRRAPAGSSAAMRDITGVVLEYNNNTDVVKIQMNDGKVLMAKLDDVEDVIAEASTTKEMKTDGYRTVTRLTLAQDVPRTNVATLGLEKGMTWVPSYLFRVINEKEARLEMKATIVNDGDAMKQLQVDLVVGNPTLFYGLQPDPVVGDYLDDLLEGRTITGANTVQMMSNATTRFSAADLTPDGPEEETTTDGEKSQDLYYFKLGIIDIEDDSKMIVPVFSQNISFKDVYEISIPAARMDEYYKSSIYHDEKPLEVYHSFRFTNNAKVPFTTGAVFALDEKENPLAQDELKYTPPGAEGVIRLSKAIDIQARNDEEVTDLQENAKRLNKISYNKATIKGQIKLANFQQKKIKVSVTKIVNGETGVMSHNGTSVKLKINPNALNPTSKITWEVELNPGEQQTLNYAYSLFVN